MTEPNEACVAEGTEMVTDTRQWWEKKTFWGAVSVACNAAIAAVTDGTARVVFTVLAAVSLALEGYFVADRSTLISGGKS